MVPVNPPIFHIPRSAYAKVLKRHRAQSLRGLTKAMPSSKSKPWTIQSQTKLSLSILSFFILTNPRRSNMPSSCGNGTAATRPRIFEVPAEPGYFVGPRNDGGKLDVNSFVVIPVGINWEERKPISLPSSFCMTLGTPRTPRAARFACRIQRREKIATEPRMRSMIEWLRPTLRRFVDATIVKIVSHINKMVALEDSATKRLLFSEMDEIRARIIAKTPDNPCARGFKVYAETDEDGIIQEILGRIPNHSRTFVEIGCGRGAQRARRHGDRPQHAAPSPSGIHSLP